MMKIVKRNSCLSVVNWNLTDSGGGQVSKHGSLLPNNIRCLVCGPSNCGKTNVLLSLLIEPTGLKFQNVYLYSKTLEQPKYKFLKNVIDGIKGMKYFSYNDKNDVISPEDAAKNSIIIFDDVAMENQENIKHYFSMGRHMHVDCFYLCQTYSKVPKQLVRDNANLIILFKQDDLNLKHAYDDHVNTDMSWNTFRNICADCWMEKYSFLVIDKEREIDKGRYRKGFDYFIVDF